MRTGRPSTLHRRRAALLSCLLVVGWIGLFAAASGAVQAAPTGSASPTPTASPPGTPTTTYPLTTSEFSLTVSPTRLVLSPDQVTGQHFVLVNRGTSPVTVEIQKRNFIGAADGSLQFQAVAPYSASNWISFDPDSLVIPPGGSRNVDLTLRVGKAPEPGDHQVALVFLVPAGKTAANISINRGIATPIYVTVPGSTTDDATELGALNARHFVMRGPVTISATLHNVGTVHRDFRGTDPLMLRAAGDDTTFPDFTVLRGADRDVKTTWHPPFLCVCHATVSFTNPDGSTQSSVVRIIVFPLYALAILLAVVALTFGGVRWRRRHFRTAVAAAAASSSAASARATEAAPEPVDTEPVDTEPVDPGDENA